MFDALTNFILYLEESIERSNDPEEIARLAYFLDKARTIRDKVVEATSIRA